MKFKEGLKKFFYETFRPRTRADYAEIFSRGGKGDAVTGKNPYPWFYSRVLLACFFVYAALSFGYSLSGLNFLATAFAGGIFADLVFIILLYELYPGRDVALILPLAVLFAGGLFSSAIAYLFYSMSQISAPYAMQAWTAFAEETAKALTVIGVLAVVRNKHPYVCFMLGAAVGGGFSAFENMWYSYSAGFSAYSLPDATQTLIIRAFGTPFSHAAWAGLFGWAVSGDKPYKKLKPYAVYAFDYVMHFFVNFPLMPQYEGWKGYPISAATGVATLIFAVYVIISSSGRKRVRVPAPVKDGALPKIITEERAPSAALSRCRAPRMAANVFAAAAIALLSFSFLGPPLFYRGILPYKYCDYSDFSQCRAVAQSGLEFSPDYDRPYAVLADVTQNYAVAFSEGDLSYVVQREQAGEYFFRYRYSYIYYLFTRFDSATNTYYVRCDGEDVPAFRNGQSLNGFQAVIPEGSETPDRMRRWELQSVLLEFNGGLYNDVAVNDGKDVLHTFIINPSVYSLYIPEPGVYRVIVGDEVPIGATEAVIFGSVFAGAAAAAGAVYLILKLKPGRYCNVG